MMDARIDAVLKRIGHGTASWLDEQELRKYIERLQAQLQDAQDKARRQEAES